MRPRETSPLWVWLTIFLMALGGATYLTGYLLIEDFVEYFKSQ